MASKKDVPFSSPFQNSLVVKDRFFPILSSCGGRNSLDQKKHPDDQQDKNDFSSFLVNAQILPILTNAVLRRKSLLGREDAHVCYLLCTSVLPNRIILAILN